MKFLHFPKWKLSSPDWVLVALVVSLTLFGLLMVYNSSVALAIRDFGNQYYYLKEQLKWVVVGLAIFGVCSVIDFRFWKSIAFPLLLFLILLLLIVLIPGVGIKALGARRWINLGFFVLQPAEFAKLSLVIYLSAWFSAKEKGRFLSFVLLLGVVVGLVILEPDLGTSLIIVFTAVVLYFLSDAPVSHFFVLTPVLVTAVIGLAILSPYRFQRLTTFFNPESDPLGASYHIRQAIIALGSGGMFGVGIGQSRQKYQYLPEANTDSIFAIIGEELGYFGALTLLILFGILLWRGFRIAQKCSDTFGKFLALGITSWIGIQIAMNIGAMVALIPLTGVPLPLISYGGSSLIIILTALGILTNISRSIRI